MRQTPYCDDAWVHCPQCSHRVTPTSMPTPGLKLMVCLACWWGYVVTVETAPPADVITVAAGDRKQKGER